MPTGSPAWHQWEFGVSSRGKRLLVMPCWGILFFSFSSSFQTLPGASCWPCHKGRFLEITGLLFHESLSCWVCVSGVGGWVGGQALCLPRPMPPPSLPCGALGSWGPLEGRSLQAQEKWGIKVSGHFISCPLQDGGGGWNSFLRRGKLIMLCGFGKSPPHSGPQVLLL